MTSKQDKLITQLVKKLQSEGENFSFLNAVQPYPRSYVGKYKDEYIEWINEIDEFIKEYFEIDIDLITLLNNVINSMLQEVSESQFQSQHELFMDILNDALNRIGNNEVIDIEETAPVVVAESKVTLLVSYDNETNIINTILEVFEIVDVSGDFLSKEDICPKTSSFINFEKLEKIRGYKAAIICIDEILNQSSVCLINSVLASYSHDKIILIWNSELELPTEFTEIDRIEFTNQQLSGENHLDLMRKIKIII